MILDKDRNDMHIHYSKEVTDYFPGDNLLHIFDYICGFPIVENRRLVKIGSGQKMKINPAMRKEGIIIFVFSLSFLVSPSNF